jgi:4-aminobutyrate aminotransferase-like enzyme
MATEALGTAFEPPDHFTTYGATNQLGIAAAHAVLDVIEGEKLMYRASSAGERFMKNLGEIQKRRPILGDVRGKGLMIGLEIVDPATQAPAADAAKKMEKSMLQRGVLISTTGVNANVLRITPPLVISDAQIDRACEAVDAALAEASAP